MFNLKISGVKEMKKSDFNALLAHVEKELQGFKRHYKLYDEVYILRNADKTQCIEMRFIRSNIISISRYNLLKDTNGKTINEVLTNESSYKLSTVQSVKILQFLESIV